VKRTLALKSLRVAELPSTGWGYHYEVGRRYRALVEQLSVFSRQQPDAYRRRVFLAALGGYAVILAVVLLLIGVAALCIGAIFFAKGFAGFGIKFAFVAGLLAFGVARSMVIERYRPDGVRLSEADAPLLFALIEQIRRIVGGPGIDAVYVSDELNASMAQPPRFMIFGARNLLTIGLPLMQSLTRDELASVVAHELGHSVGDHGRSAAFVYRVRMRWMQLSERLPDGLVAGLLRRFFSWYGPWFNAYSFVLARSQEYEADRIAARFTSPEIAASALTRIDLQAERFGQHWNAVWRESRHSDAPAAMPYGAAREALRSAEFEQVSLGRLLARLTDLNDTHPSLADRLAAWGVPAGLPRPLQVSAAEELLGDLEAELVHRFDEEWWAANQNWWEHWNAQAKEEAAEHQRLEDLIRGGAATLDDHTRYIELAELIEGLGAANDARRRALVEFPDAHLVRFQLGAGLLELGDGEGVQHIENAIAQWPAIGTAGYRLIIDHLRASAASDVEPYVKLLEQSEAIDEIASAEANSIDEGAILAPLELGAEARSQLGASLGAIEGLKWVVAGQRTLKTRGERQIIFAFDCKDDFSPQLILDQIGELMLPNGDYLGFRQTRSEKWLVKALNSLEGSALFVR
jgi:Zn-dependent protease with chaperone function